MSNGDKFGHGKPKVIKLNFRDICQIDQVSAVLVTAVVGDRVDLVVRSNAGDAALRQIIDIGYTLLPDPGAGQATYRLR